MSRMIDPEHMSREDVEYVRQRPTLHREFLMQGLGDPLSSDYEGLDFDPNEEAEEPAEGELGSGPDDANHNPDTPVEPSELPEEKQWNKSMTNEELENVVAARNADYDDDEQIEVTGTGKDGKVKKDDLVAALEQDDEELAGEE